MWLTYRVGKVRRRLAGQTQSSLADITAITEETVSVSGMLLTKTFGQQAAAVQRYRVANSKLAALQIRQAIGRALVFHDRGHRLLDHAGAGLLAGRLPVPSPVRPARPRSATSSPFTTLQSRLFFPLGQLLNVQVEAQGALALFDRIFEYLDLPVEIADKPDAVALTPDHVRGHVRFRHVSFRYRRLVRPTASTSRSNGAEPAPTDTDRRCRGGHGTRRRGDSMQTVARPSSSACRSA